MNGEAKIVQLPFECQELEDLKLSLKRVYELPNLSFSLKFETTDGQVADISDNSTYTTHLCRMKRIVIIL
jgi:hypothetical protein